MKALVLGPAGGITCPRADPRRRLRGAPVCRRAPSQVHPSPWEPFFRAIGQLDRAVNDLRRRAPDFSAATPLPRVAADRHTSRRPGVAHGRSDLARGSGTFSMVADVDVAVFRDHAASEWPRFGTSCGDPGSASMRPSTIAGSIAGCRRSPCSCRFIENERVVPSLVKAMTRLDYPARPARNSVHNRSRRSHDAACSAASGARRRTCES